MNCILCKIADPIERISEQYAQSLFIAIGSKVQLLFQAFLGVWFLYHIIFKALIKGEVIYYEVVMNLIIFSLVMLVLSNHNVLWEWIYKPFDMAINELVLIVLKSNMIGGKLNQSQTGLVMAVDGVMQQVYQLGKIIVHSWNPFQFFSGIIILLVYILVGTMSFAYIIEYMFTLLLITAFSPLLIIAFAFAATRNSALCGVKNVVGGALTMLFSIAAMGITLIIADELFSVIIVDGVVDYRIKNFAWGEDFLSILILGLISLFHQLKVKTIAYSLVGISDGPGAAASVLGVVSSAIGFVRSSGSSSNKTNQ